jgi:ring-1,2-phenylacetyl-CoA epoxidase subunit PaaD
MVSEAPESAEVLELRVWEALAGVNDPEIPPLSITDLGIVERVRVTEGGVDVELLPTFSGCPALDVIREDAEAAVRSVAGDRSIDIRFSVSPPWTTDRITPEGREALRRYGMTPPGDRGVAGRTFVPLATVGSGLPSGATCPFCGSEDTVLESGFGVTLCRSTHFCRACRNPFEAFKPKHAT